MKIEIPSSNSKLTKNLVFSVVFLICGLWIIIFNPEVSNPIFNNSIVKALAGYGSIVMGALAAYLAIKKLLDKRPGLIITEEGIYDYTTFFNFGLIPWADISQIYEGTIQASIASKQRFVTIGLINPDKYITKEKNIFKKFLLSANAKSYRSPIHISSTSLATSHIDLIKLVNDNFEKYKITT